MTRICSTLFLYINIALERVSIISTAMRTFALLCSLCLALVANAKNDTIFYDKNWKGVPNREFASFYRIVTESKDPNYRNRYRDYYITGELQSEGGYISFDKYDDHKSIFDGDYTHYFKSGSIQSKGTKINGEKEGEYTSYYEDGKVKIHAYYKKGKLDGLYSKYNKNGDKCTQIEYINGEPRYDYYVVIKDGYSCKFRHSDKTPIWETPNKSEMKKTYNSGNTWLYYKKNGMFIAASNIQVEDYGKYFRIPVVIINHSILPIFFNPDEIRSTLIDKKNRIVQLHVLNVDEYMKKVTTNQSLIALATALDESSAAINAGYSTSTTNSSYNNSSHSYGSTSSYGSSKASGSASANVLGYGVSGKASGQKSYQNNSNYQGHNYNYGNSSSTTTTYDGAAAYQARIIAQERIAELDNAQLAERTDKRDKYLKKTTIQPGETLSGYIHIKKKKGLSMDVTIYINDIPYYFPWTIAQ